MQSIEFDIDEKNSIDFKVCIEGSNAPAKIRLVCESDDVSYVFSGESTDEENIVNFSIPKMRNRISEGLHNCKVEVFVENRYFVPIEFIAEFKKTIDVVAEQFTRKVNTNVVSVSATVMKKISKLDQNLKNSMCKK